MILRTYEFCCNQKERVGRLRHCLVHSYAPATDPLPRRPRIHPEKQRLMQEQSARSPRPSPDARPLPSRERPTTPARKCESARSRSRRSAPPEPLFPGASRSPAPPCDPLAVSAAVCATVPAAASGPYPSSASVGFRSSGFPRPPLPPFAFPSRPQRPLHRVIASRRCLSCPRAPSRARRPLPVACLLPLPARPPNLRPPLPTSGLSRSPPVPHLPITGERRTNN